MRIVVVVHVAGAALARRPAPIDGSVKALVACLSIRSVEVVGLTDSWVAACRQDGRG